jgi:uncharacterized UBP type Zn finger protein
VRTCGHVATIVVVDSNDDGCDECLATGGHWVHLRMCLQCGRVGCCDDSPGRHATAHHYATGHPVVRSLEHGESWCWCYLDELAFEFDIPPG